MEYIININGLETLEDLITLPVEIHNYINDLEAALTIIGILIIIIIGICAFILAFQISHEKRIEEKIYNNHKEIIRMIQDLENNRKNSIHQLARGDNNSHLQILYKLNEILDETRKNKY